jgi:hypothetical protein
MDEQELKELKKQLKALAQEIKELKAELKKHKLEEDEELKKQLESLVNAFKEVKEKILEVEDVLNRDKKKVHNNSAVPLRKNIIPKDTAEKLEKYIQAEIEKALEKGEKIDVLKAQEIIAEKLKNKNWYRGGKTDENSRSTYESNTQGRKVEIKMVWKLYKKLPTSNLFESRDRSKMGINKDYILKLDKKNIYEKGSLQGTLNIKFDDLGVPDKLIILIEIGGKVVTDGKLEYGQLFNDADNTWEQTYTLDNITNYDITIRIEHPEDDPNFNNTDFKLEIKMDGVGKLKEPIMENEISDMQYTKEKR